MQGKKLYNVKLHPGHRAKRYQVFRDGSGGQYLAGVVDAHKPAELSREDAERIARYYGGETEYCRTDYPPNVVVIDLRNGIPERVDDNGHLKVVIRDYDLEGCSPDDTLIRDDEDGKKYIEQMA